MPVPCFFDNILLDRRCIAAYFHGTIAELHAEIHLVQGCQGITVADLMSRGEVMADAWRVGDPDKPNCYFCDAQIVPGTLCRCYDHVMSKRHFNVNDPRGLERLPAETVVETFVCGSCGHLDGVTAAVALKQHTHAGKYRGRKVCSACFLAQPRRPKGRKPHKPAEAPSLVQQASEAVVSGQA